MAPRLVFTLILPNLSFGVAQTSPTITMKTHLIEAFRVPRAAPGGFILLGAPVGDIPFSRDIVNKRILKIKAIFEHLTSPP